MSIRLTATSVIADTKTRTISGTLFRYGEVGMTSAGPLTVAAGALTIPDNLSDVTLTKEHDRDAVRGHLVIADDTTERLYVAASVANGALGDTALREVTDRTRAGLSFDLENAVIENGVIVSADLVAVGQVAEPAFNSARIDRIAASNHSKENKKMTPEQIARLAELRALDTLTQDEALELSALIALETANDEADDAGVGADDTTEPATGGATAAAPPATPVKGSAVPAVPAGHSPVTAGKTSPLQDMIGKTLAAWHQTGNVGTAITAALSDITNTAHTGNIEQPAWSDELWSGIAYQQLYADLYNSGDLSAWKGEGWRFTKKLAMKDYAGDKAAIPTDTVTTQASSWEAARLAVGVDIDRKFYDFPNSGFLNSLFSQIAESWTEQLDSKVRAYTIANAVAATRKVVINRTSGEPGITAPVGSFSAADVGRKITGTGIPAATTITAVTSSSAATLSANASAGGATTAVLESGSTNLLKVVGRLVQAGRATRLGTLTGVIVNDDDLFDLLDVTADALPYWLDLWGIDPANFRTDDQIGRGTVYGVVKPAATLRTLGGSPIRINAQNIANGGVDEAAFGYWAIEKHHTAGILKAAYTPA